MNRLDFIKLAGLCAAAPILPVQAMTRPLTGELVRDNNNFCFKLYSKLEKKGNLFFSAYSVSSALAMTSLGASGNTLAQMHEALQLQLSQEQLHPAFNLLNKDFNTPNSTYTLKVANALWGQQNYPFKKAFLAENLKFYKAGLTSLDFTESEASRKRINNWVEKNTAGKIEDLLPAGSISVMTRLVLTNAIYFKGSWQYEFNPEMTYKSDFNTVSGKAVKVDMMQKKEELRHLQNDEIEAVELPYKGDELKMQIFMPAKGKNLDGLEKKLPASIDGWSRKMRHSKIKLHLPKFKFTIAANLNDPMKQLGMVDAFSRKADFSRMEASKQLYISDILHKAFVEVNEEGTEAAAATAVIINKSRSFRREPLIRFDRPFLFTIRHKNGPILFMGRVENPLRSGV